jgi:hypothetical protein
MPGIVMGRAALLKRIVTPLASLLLALVMSQAAWSEPVWKPTGTQPLVEVEGLAFPRRIAGLRRQAVADYGRPEFGHSVRYVNDDGTTWADVFVYDRGKSLRPEHWSEDLADETSASLAQIRELARAGMYREARFGKPIRLGRFITAMIALELRNESRASLLALTIHHRKFVKVRLSYRKDRRPHAAQSFIAGVEKMLR